MPSPDDLLMHGEVIALLHARGFDLAHGTWSTYVANGKAPAPVDRYGQWYRWRRADIEAWERPARRTSTEPRQRAAANRIGMDPDEYLRHRALGERWCAKCKRWHDASVFRVDRLRRGGLAGHCYLTKTRDSAPAQPANA